jgi:hypothetical protein
MPSYLGEAHFSPGLHAVERKTQESRGRETGAFFLSIPFVLSCLSTSLTLGDCLVRHSLAKRDQATDPRSQARSRHRRIDRTL